MSTSAEEETASQLVDALFARAVFFLISFKSSDPMEINNEVSNRDKVRVTTLSPKRWEDEEFSAEYWEESKTSSSIFNEDEFMVSEKEIMNSPRFKSNSKERTTGRTKSGEKERIGKAFDGITAETKLPLISMASEKGKDKNEFPNDLSKGTVFFNSFKSNSASLIKTT